MELKGVRNQMSNPPSSEKLTLDEAGYNFLVLVMSPKEVCEDEVTVNPKSTRTEWWMLTKSYNMSKGRVKTTKHVPLSMTVKNLTWNSEVGSILNRFLHTVSYNELHEMVSSLALRQAKKRREKVWYCQVTSDHMSLQVSAGTTMMSMSKPLVEVTQHIVQTPIWNF